MLNQSFYLVNIIEVSLVTRYAKLGDVLGLLHILVGQQKHHIYLHLQLNPILHIDHEVLSPYDEAEHEPAAAMKISQLELNPGVCISYNC